jgi:RNA polymerase sigma-70 factor, ECF subfamily
VERPVAHAPAAQVPAQRAAGLEEADLVARLRAGDEDAFGFVVEQWSRAMLHVARSHVSTQASAHEVVQETWLAVIKGLDSFEGRSSLKTWTFRILVNTAKSRGVRESRSVPMASLTSEDGDGPTVDPDRFRGPDDQWPGHWTVQGAPQRWRDDPAVGPLRAEVRDLIGRALDDLPDRQREVVVLRDVQGCDSEEVCAILGLSRPNQRVLLHRGRAKIRLALEDYYRQGEQ